MTRVRRTPAPSEVGMPRTLRSRRTGSPWVWVLMSLSMVDFPGGWGRPGPAGTATRTKNRCAGGTVPGHPSADIASAVVLQGQLHVALAPLVLAVHQPPADHRSQRDGHHQQRSQCVVIGAHAQATREDA